MKFYIGLLFILLCSWGARAQQDAQFSHYMFNNLYFNPGYAGIDGQSEATLLHRSQWLGYQGIDDGGAPLTQLFSFSHPLRLFNSPTVNSGIGAVITNDQLGPWRIFNAKLAYSYHITLQNGGTIGVGIQAGMIRQAIDGSVLRASQPNDVIVDGLSGEMSAQIQPDLAAGIFYKTPKYYAGVGLNHLGRSEFDFNVNPDSIASMLSRHMYVTAGYSVFLGRNMVLTPSTIVQTDFAQTTFNFGATLSLNDEKYWGGLTLRNSIADRPVPDDGKRWASDAFVILLGMSFLDDNALKVGYAFDIVTSGVSAKNPTSHEIMLSYVLPISPVDGAPPLKTPRYRHQN